VSGFKVQTTVGRVASVGGGGKGRGELGDGGVSYLGLKDLWFGFRIFLCLLLGERICSMGLVRV